MYYSQLTCGEGDGTPLQYSCLENPMDGGAWWAAVHGVAKSQTRLSDFPFTFYFPVEKDPMIFNKKFLRKNKILIKVLLTQQLWEKVMAPHSSTLA